MREIKLKTTYLASIILVAVLTTSIFAAIFVGAAGETTITENSFRNDYSYLIFEDGGTYYAKSGETGEICWSSTNAATVIQAALNGLTSGRTWKETVIVNGNFTINTLLSIPSYTKLIINGKITSASNVYMNMIGMHSVHDVEIEGGILDNNEANYVGEETGVVAIIYSQHSSSITINRVTTRNSLYDHYLFDTYTTDVLVTKCIADGGRDDGFNPLETANILFDGCIAKNMGNDGFHISTSSTNVTVSNSFSHDNTANGITNYGKGNKFIGNHLYNNTCGVQVVAGANYTEIASNIIIGTSSGIGIIAEGSSGNKIFGLNIHDNEVFLSGNWGIYTAYTPYAKIINNFVDTTALYDGIALQIGCNNTIVMGNTVINPNRDDFNIYTGNAGIRVIANDFPKGYVEDAGHNSKWFANTGFVTENSFSGANTTTTTAVLNHGLASTATYVWVSFNTSAITGYTCTSSTTQVTITPTGTLPESWTCYVRAEYQP